MTVPINQKIFWEKERVFKNANISKKKKKNPWETYK